MQIKIKPTIALRVLLICVGLLIAAHIVSEALVHLGIRAHSIGFVDVTMEKNIPTLFSSMLLMVCGLLCVITALAEKGTRCIHPFWCFMALAFVGIGVDETIMLHETLGDKLHERIDTSGIFRFAWVIPYGIAMLVILAAGARFFFRLPKTTRIQFAVAGLIYVAGGMGLEMAGSARFDAHGFDFVYSVINLVEEAMEMLGIVLFIHAFLDHIARAHPDLSLGVAPPKN